MTVRNPTFDSLMARLDDLGVEIEKAKRRWFWIGWATGTIGTYLGIALHASRWLW